MHGTMLPIFACMHFCMFLHVSCMLFDVKLILFSFRQLLDVVDQVQVQKERGVLHHADIPALYDDCRSLLDRLLHQQGGSSCQNITGSVHMHTCMHACMHTFNTN